MHACYMAGQPVTCTVLEACVNFDVCLAETRVVCFKVPVLESEANCDQDLIVLDLLGLQVNAYLGKPNQHTGIQLEIAQPVGTRVLLDDKHPEKQRRILVTLTTPSDSSVTTCKKDAQATFQPEVSSHRPMSTCCP